jgi:hypothetical protein
MHAEWFQGNRANTQWQAGLTANLLNFCFSACPFDAVWLPISYGN